MRHSKLSDHTFKKGVFITPFNSLPMMQEIEDGKSWSAGRLPEYLWIGLILEHFGREEGLKRCYSIISVIREEAPSLDTARLSQMLLLTPEVQEKIWSRLVDLGVKEALAPLTVFLTVSKAPVFAKHFYCSDWSLEDRLDTLLNTMRKCMDQQSDESTDIRFVALCFYMLSGKIHLQKETVELLDAYPTKGHGEEIMRLTRPVVRSTEQMVLVSETVASDYLKDFWRCISEMTECALYSVEYPTESRDISLYMEHLYELFKYLASLFTIVEPLDERMNVLLGIATYSYKRFKEVYENQLFNTVSGRSCVRVLIEDYLMLKYLVKNESSHENIWRDYQIYGIGLYKLVLQRYREKEGYKDSHFEEGYVEALVNEYKSEEFIDMDTNYFNKQNVRLKAEAVGEKELFGLYYDYDSSFEHGLWGAIRETALLKCDNPAHRYHCVPDIDGKIVLKTVLPDCIMIMNKTVTYLNELYGIPEQLLNEVINFEIEPIA